MEFQEKRDIGYCGLACVLCNVEGCSGCKARGCADFSTCSVYHCATAKELDGCYQCGAFPYDEKMLQGVRNRAFNRYARQNGKQALLHRLQINHAGDIAYHRPGGLKGDYDSCETEQEVLRLLNGGKPDPYEKCPAYESEHFHLRLVSMDDAEDLLACYSDPNAQKFFNADNCTSDFRYATLEEMRRCIQFWLDAYASRSFIRYGIVDKQTRMAVGTVEIFGGERGGRRSEHSVLRIDIHSEYEKEEPLTELLRIADSFFYDVYTEKFITKAIPEAARRIHALALTGYVPAQTGDGEQHEHYYAKKSI